MQRIISKVWPYLKNKYYLTIIVFVIWLAFFDTNNFYEIYRLRKTYSNMEKERSFYLEETAKVNLEKQELFSNLKSLEKFARERYYMKRDDEDIFIFETVKETE